MNRLRASPPTAQSPADGMMIAIVTRAMRTAPTIRSIPAGRKAATALSTKNHALGFTNWKATDWPNPGAEATSASSTAAMPTTCQARYSR